jgi:hypothetical protein
MAFIQEVVSRQLEKLAFRTHTPSPCVSCGGFEAFFVHTRAQPDFDVSVLSGSLRSTFLKKWNGYCTVCGLFQDFRKLTNSEILKINELSKDELTRDPTFSRYPPPSAAIANFNDNYFSKRLTKWTPYLDRCNIKNALFLRYWWGAAPAFIADRYGTRVSGVEMSVCCERYTLEKLPFLNQLKGAINGGLSGEFLDSGPYDAVFVFHVLGHSFEVQRSIEQIRGLVRPGGVAIFTHESVRKPSNPFHRIHPSETQFVNLIKNSFTNVQRVDDCEDVYHASINPYSIKGDVPDFIAS